MTNESLKNKKVKGKLKYFSNEEELAELEAKPKDLRQSD
jgi:hypothetical protein